MEPGDFPAGKVSQGLAGVASSEIVLGAQEEFNAGGTYHISAAFLSATQFVAAYQDRADANHGKARVGTVTGTAITFGAEAEFNAGVTYWNSAAALSPTQFVVAYEDQSYQRRGRARAGTVSGTSITFGAVAEFRSTRSEGLQYISVAALSATQFVVAYTDWHDSGDGRAKVGTVSGTSITFGAEAEFRSAGQATHNSVAALSPTQFVVAYTDWHDSGHGTAKVGTVSGTDVTFGAEAEFLSAGGATYNSVAALSATKFVVACQDNFGAGHGTARVGTVTGTAIAFGAVATFNSTGPANRISVAVLSPTQFVAAYEDHTLPYKAPVIVGTVSGTSITFGARTLFSSVISASMSAVALSPTQIVVAYDDNVNHGIAKVGTLPSGASLAASTPAAYGTAATTTKVAFCGWFRNPSA